jgi:trehalose-phosphatase
MLRAGDGAWVETKPVSVVLHVREAAPSAGAEALEWLGPQADSVDGAHVKAGSAVLELFTRSGDKGSAMTRLRAEVDAATTVFAGDDLTDEEAFAALGPSDITIKVGDAPTIAEHRLRDPDAVRDWLRDLSLVIG